MNEPEMMELQDVRDENLPSFLVYRPSRISNVLRLTPLRILAAGLLGILCAGIVFVIANLIIFAALPSPETQTNDAEIFIDLDLDGEEIYLDLDLENPIELEDLYDQDDLTTPPFIPTPQFMNQEMPNTPDTPQDPTPPVLVFYRPAKTPSRLPKPANDTLLSSSLPDPHPAQAPPRDTPPVTTDCTDRSPCPPALPPYHTPFFTLFTKINSRFVAITPSITNRSPTSTTPTTTTATNYTTVPSITTTPTPTTTTTITVTSSIAVTSAPIVHIIVATPLNIEPTLDLPTEAQGPEKEPVSCGYSRGKVILYFLLAILVFLLLVVVYEMMKLYQKQPWSLWMADNVRTVEGSAVRRHVVSRHGDTVALRTLRKGSTTYFQVTDANPTSRNPHRQPCCPANCGIMHSHHHHLPRVSPHCRNHRWLAHPARN